jgi:Sec-independent protein secretion pathway component TatC
VSKPTDRSASEMGKACRAVHLLNLFLAGVFFGNRVVFPAALKWLVDIGACNSTRMITVHDTPIRF